MSKFRTGEGGSWLVTQTLGPDHEVINSCRRHEDAVDRAEHLASQSPDQPVTVYRAVEVFSTTRTPVERTVLIQIEESIDGQ